MSITPFLPGLPTPAAPAAPVAGAAPGTPPGEGEAAFGDALAAALAGALLMPAELSVSAPELSVSAPELSVSAAELSVSTAAPADPADGAAAPATPAVLVASGSRFAAQLTEQALAPGTATGASRQLADGGAEPVVPIGYDGADADAGATAASTPGTARPHARGDGSAVDAPGSATPINNSSVQTNNSAAQTNNSAVQTNNSAVERVVVQQVFPEVTRVVSTAGNGTHRITLTLQPEQLGEVRVTLVVKDGSVHVRLAGSEGGDAAAVHRALASGAPELQRLLERSGNEARISVRDAFGQLTSTAATSSPTNPPAPAGQQTGLDGQAHEGRSDQATRDQATRDQFTRDQSTREHHHDRPAPRDRRHDPGRGHDVVRPVVVPESAQRSGRLDRTV